MRNLSRRQQTIEWIMLIAALTFLGGTVAQRAYDPSPAAYARAVLGGENIASQAFEWVAVWVGTLRERGSLADVVLPVDLERDLRSRFEGSALQIQTRHAQWLLRFETAREVEAHYRGWAAESCRAELAADPQGCHAVLSARLTSEIRRLTVARERARRVRIVAILAFLLSTVGFAAILWQRSRTRWTRFP